MTFVRVAAADEIPTDTGRVVQAGGKVLAVFNVGGNFYAIDNVCTHAGGPLGRGTLAGTVVTCPIHESRFDITSGAVIGPPARLPVRSYLILVEAGEVLIDVD